MQGVTGVRCANVPPFSSRTVRQVCPTGVIVGLSEVLVGQTVVIMGLTVVIVGQNGVIVGLS